MTRVLSKRATYDYETLMPLIFEMIDALGGGDLVRKNSRVVIKPNLLAPAPPDRAMLTHPMVVRAVVEYVLRNGGKPVISDSPAMGSFDKVMKESGIRSALGGLDVECREFKTSLTVDVGEPFSKLEIAEEALKADVLFNLPKLKTHSQMLLTLGVKNLFGCIVGLRKPQWHLRAGVDREMFAKLLVRICETLKPSITLLDGVLAMEGEGPGKGGDPRHIGVLMGSRNPVALDIAVCRMLGMSEDELLTNRFAEEAGLVDGPVDVEGELISVMDFKFPRITPLVFGPQCAHGLMRKHLIQRPVVQDSRCKSCGECWRYCPACAITHDEKRIAFDYDRCIRCYCCIEVCPHGALKTEEPFLGRVFTKIIKRS